jgi:mannose-6-phosphate isomerase|tara:strand:+ start:208 stop:696 length:489 start_codon:yes stop_codon:yes gene_type:complete
MATLFKTIEKQILSQGLNIASFDFERPWGGFFVIEEEDAQRFSNIYFDGYDVASLRKAGKLSPKILAVKPQARLSWQYHHRRAETWHVLEGPVGVIRSFDDTEKPMITHHEGDVITLKKGERHRLIGLESWGVVAEFWQHTDAKSPSNEQDIVRLQDDYARE